MCSCGFECVVYFVCSNVIVFSNVLCDVVWFVCFCFVCICVFVFVTVFVCFACDLSCDVVWFVCERSCVCVFVCVASSIYVCVCWL